MWNSQRILGSVVLLLLGISPAVAGELSNVTVGRFQDFTVVTLMGNDPMSVTHQMVEAKDGKPHRIVVDVTGATHSLPQNNYTELPEGSITALRTSQFAVSPEPVVRVVLDLTHAAAYKLETFENQVRVMVSLPGDPPMDNTWSAREGASGAPFEAPAAYAEATPSQTAEIQSASDANASTEGATESVDAANEGSPAAEPSTSVSTEPVESPATQTDSVLPGESESQPSDHPATAQPEGEVKALPLAPAGALALSEEAQSQPLPETQATASNAPAQTESATAIASAQVAAPAGENAEDATPEATSAAEETSAETSQFWSEDEAAPVFAADEPASDAPQVPLPEGAKKQPERVIDYNLPIPAALAGNLAEEHVVAPAEESSDLGEPRLAVTAPAETTSEPLAAVEEPAALANDAATPPTGTDAAVTDEGSAPVASLSTLPPLPESAAELMPERTQVIYHTQGRRDPFKPLLSAGGYNAAALPDVTSLRLVGLLHDVQESWGLSEDANGYGYILRKGDRVKNGSLAKLTNNRAFFNLTEFGWSRSVHLDLEPEG